MSTRILALFCLLITVLLITASVGAQQPKVPRIGFVTGSGEPNNPGPNVEAFRQGLQSLGYIEGKNILVEYRYPQGTDRIPSLVAELVQLKVDVFVSPILSAILAAKQATKTIPIVMLINGNPVELGIIDSLARPGGNITGITRFNRELSGKRLELFKEVAPGISHVGVLIEAAETTGSGGALEVYEAAARGLKIRLTALKVSGPNPDLEGAFRDAAKGRVNGLITARAGLLFRYRKKIADLAIKNRLPSMFEGSDFVEAGGLVSYASNDSDQYKRVAYFVDRILKGAKPTDLPVEQPTKFEFVINLKAAKQIGLTIPPNVLARADKVIR